MGQDDGKKNNPWGNNTNRPNNPWGNNGGHNGGRNRGGHGGGQPPEIDDMIRQAQENFKQIMPNGNGTGIVFGLGLLAILFLWLSSGFYKIEPGESGVIKRFGQWSTTVKEEGLHYHMPWPVETVTKVNVSNIRSLSIGFNSIGANKRDVPSESLMLTQDSNIVDLDLVVQWNINSAEEFIFNIRDQENTIKKVAESAIREVVGQTDMFPIITTQRGAVAERARNIMIENLEQYQSGVQIRQVLIQSAEVHPDVQAAFQDVQSAKQDAENVQNEAEAYREGILPKAEGEAIKVLQQAEAYKQSKIAEANGDAQRFKSVYESYKKDKNVTRERMYIETMESVMGNANKVIMDGKAGSGVVPYLPVNELGKKR